MNIATHDSTLRCFRRHFLLHFISQRTIMMCALPFWQSDTVVEGGNFNEDKTQSLVNIIVIICTLSAKSSTCLGIWTLISIWLEGQWWRFSGYQKPNEWWKGHYSDLLSAHKLWPKVKWALTSISLRVLKWMKTIGRLCTRLLVLLLWCRGRKWEWLLTKSMKDYWNMRNSLLHSSFLFGAASHTDRKAE